MKRGSIEVAACAGPLISQAATTCVRTGCATDNVQGMSAEPVSAATSEDGAGALDIHTTAGKLALLHSHIDEAVHAGSQKAIDLQHSKGKMTARERIDALLDPGSFVETDAFARHRAVDFGLDKNKPAGDGVVTGYGTVDGRPICVFSQDVTVFGGSLGEVYGAKIVKVMDLALKTGCPVVGLNEGSGARIQEGIMGLAGYGEIFYRNVMSSGVIPQISLILGPCAGGHVYSPALTDFILMVDQTSKCSSPALTSSRRSPVKTSPRKTSAVRGRTTPRAASPTSWPPTRPMPSSWPRLCCPTCRATTWTRRRATSAADLDSLEPDLELDTFIPDSSNQPYDMHTVLGHILDDGEFLEVMALYATNLITGFGRVDGRPVGVVANQPMSFAGTLDINASEKAARFVRTCDAFNIPVLTFVDVPGFLPGTDQEWQGIIRRGAKLLYAYAEATVPKVTIITRKAYGGAYDVMGSKHLRADINLAWPSAEIAVMGAQGAVNIVQRRALAAAGAEGKDVEALRAEFITQYGDRFANPYIAAERGLRRRGHRAERDAQGDHQGAAPAEEQAGIAAAEEARKHPTVSDERGLGRGACAADAAGRQGRPDPGGAGSARRRAGEPWR